MIRFTKPRKDWTWITKSKSAGAGNPKSAALGKLRAFLTAAEPDVIEILVSNWDKQANSITYKELREAYLAGDLSADRWAQWTAAYSTLINTTLAPQWQAAANAAAQAVQAKYPKFIYEPSISASMDFLQQHGAELVTNIVSEQRDAIKAIIQHCSGYTAVTPDEAARMIRPCIGLTKPQALANARYRESVKDAYLDAHPKANPATAEKKAEEAAAKYAGKQHRYRAQNIARTELAYAYNAGAYGATKDAQAQGYIGDCVKTWLTAANEQVCPRCAAMDGEKRNMDELFSNGQLLPPAHPSCRCAVEYEEIPGTNLTGGAIQHNRTSGQAPKVETARRSSARQQRQTVTEEATQAAPIGGSGGQSSGSGSSGSGNPGVPEEVGTVDSSGLSSNLNSNLTSNAQEELTAGGTSGIIGLTTSDGHTVRAVNPHFFERSGERNVEESDAIDALVSPMHITPVKYNERGKPSVQYIGSRATVVYNPDTDIAVTAWQTGKRFRRKYGG